MSMIQFRDEAGDVVDTGHVYIHTIKVKGDAGEAFQQAELFDLLDEIEKTTVGESHVYFDIVDEPENVDKIVQWLKSVNYQDRHHKVVSPGNICFWKRNLLLAPALHDVIESIEDLEDRDHINE